MAEHPNAKAVHDGLEAFRARGDAQTGIQMFTDDAVIVAGGNNLLTGEYRGQDGILTSLRAQRSGTGYVSGFGLQDARPPRRGNARRVLRRGRGRSLLVLRTKGDTLRTDRPRGVNPGEAARPNTVPSDSRRLPPYRLSFPAHVLP